MSDQPPTPDLPNPPAEPIAENLPVWQSRLQAFVGSNFFQRFIVGLILGAAVLIGLETSVTLMDQYGTLFKFLDKVILWIFAAEAALKMAQYGKHWYRYFHDPWNIFDFTIVVVCFIPVGDTHFAAVLRLARILRALRLLHAVPRLQLLVSCLVKSIPSMGYVSMLLGLIFYVYAVVGVFLFRDNDPIHFSTLGAALLSLFRVVTLEDWTDIMYIQMYGLENYTSPDFDTTVTHMPIIGMLYFVSFVLIGTMVVLNLFIGVIINSMEEAQKERERAEIVHQRETEEGLTLDQEIKLVEHDIDALRDHLQHLILRMQLNQEDRKTETDRETKDV